MATLNKLVREYTHGGVPAPRIDLVSQLERSVMSCLLWEDEFYESGQLIGARIAELCSKVPPHEVARIAIQAKQDMRLRHVPLLLARELCRTKEGRVQLKLVMPKVITRADDITEFLAIYWAGGKQPIAKQVKLLLGDAFREFDEYQLAKYNGGSKAVKLKDVIRMIRPKPYGGEQSALWGRLVKGELKTPDTWEVAISANGVNKKDEWVRLLAEKKLGGLAMLRNLRNIREADVDANDIRDGISCIDAGRLLPINFINAAKYNPQFEPEIEAKFIECFANKPSLGGRTIILVDVSSSMDDKLSGRSELSRMDVACSLAMIGRELFDQVKVITFSNSVVEVPPRHGFALRDAIIQSQQHGGTLLGQAVNAVSGQCDRLIVITDEQSQDSVPQVKGYMINVASNKNGVGYGTWLHIDGWSDSVLDYIVKYEQSIASGSIG